MCPGLTSLSPEPCYQHAGLAGPGPREGARVRFSPAVWLALLSSRMGLCSLQRKEPEAGPRRPACWLGAASTNVDHAPSPSLRIQKQAPEMWFHRLRSSCSSALPHLQDSWPGLVFGAQVTRQQTLVVFWNPGPFPQDLILPNAWDGASCGQGALLVGAQPRTGPGLGGRLKGCEGGR